MGGCTSAPKPRPKAGIPQKGGRRKISDDDLTIIDTERLKAEQRRRLAEEEELTRMIYAEKAALKEITGKLIVKQASCESLMDLLDTEELTDISLEEASFRAQKRARRKHMKRSHDGGLHDWMVCCWFVFMFFFLLFIIVLWNYYSFIITWMELERHIWCI